MTQTSVRKVLYSAEPIVGESLSGFVARVAYENRHGNAALILGEAGYLRRNNARTAFYDFEVVPMLEQVLKVGDGTLSALIHPVVGGPEKKPIVDFFGAYVPRDLLESQNRRVSPLALRNSGHHRAIWSHHLIPYCQETGAILIDRCPSAECGADLRWNSARGIDQCGQCGADLKAAAVELVDAAIRREIAPVVDLLNPDPQVHVAAMAAVAEPLRKFNRGTLFEFAWRLASLTVPTEAHLKDAHRKNFTAQEKIARLTAMAQVLRDWPNGFREGAASLGLDMLAKRLRWFRSPHIRRDFDSQMMDVMQEFYPDIFRNCTTITCVISFFPDLICLDEVIGILKILNKSVAHLHRKGLLKPHATTSSRLQLRNCFKRSEIEALAARFRDRVDVERCAFFTGFSQNGIEQLICLGHLNQVTDPAVCATYPGLQIEDSSFARLMGNIMSCSAEIGGRTLSLRHALEVIGGREKPIGPIIQAMLAGEIRYAIDPDEFKLVRKLRVSEDDVDSLAGYAFETADYPDFTFISTMNRGEASAVLNVVPDNVYKAIQTSAKHCRAKKQLLKRDGILELTRKRISLAEIKRRWLGRSRRLPPEIRSKPEFQPIDALGYDREVTESFFEGTGSGNAISQTVPRSS